MKVKRLIFVFLFVCLALTTFQLPVLTKGQESPEADLGEADSRIDERVIQTMNYHDVAETASLLNTLDQSSNYVDRRVIGYSYDYRDPGNVQSYPIYALRISADADDSVQDNHDKNSILIECGMHPREWLASESCLLLAKYLADNRTNAATAVPELLDHVDVWVIPITTPSGRVIDDQNGGDPNLFFDDPLYEGKGWRGNGDTRLCNMGVNVARNFSRGFTDEAARVFCGKEYRGFAPFSTSEANAVRQFVLNHSISMALIVHTTSQKIWNRWGEGDIAGARMIAESKRLWENTWASPADKNLWGLAIDGFGGGNGQFSAWLPQTSLRSSNDDDEVAGPWGQSDDIPMAGDFDCDGEQDDVVLFRPGDHKWYYDYDQDGTMDTSFGPWALSSDRLFAGDFDRDGCMDDLAAFRPSNLKWYYETDRIGGTDKTVEGCGMSDYIPMAVDLNSDGYIDDRVAYRPSDRLWYVDYFADCNSADYIPIGPWGNDGDRPFAGDFDRDGYADDLGVFRPSNQMWYYDVNHNGDTDHASGPWAMASGLPIAGDFDGTGSAGGDGRMDDVGVYNPDDRKWYYDWYHSAAIQQLDEGSLRAIQTIYIELPFANSSSYISPYRQSATDTSNGFHPSGDAVYDDIIAKSFFSTAQYLIRQARAPGCPTNDTGSAEPAHCPTQDHGLVSAKIIPLDANWESRGVLQSIQSKRTSWSDVEPARLQLNRGVYRLVYRVQNFGDTMAGIRSAVKVSFHHCPNTSDCWSTDWTAAGLWNMVGVRDSRTGSYEIDLSDVTGEGEWYEITLDVTPSSAPDDFTSNNKKVIKLQTVDIHFLPLVFVK